MTMKEALHALEEVKQAIELAYSSGYSAGKQQRKWIGLTEGERNDLEDYCKMTIGKVAFDAIEAKLKERNT